MTYDLKVERLIDASPAEVFDAYTDPEAQRVWFTILNKDMTVENEVDLRVGGKSVITWGFSPDEMFRETNIFEVVDPPHRLVSKSSYTSPDGSILETDVEVTFRDEGGKTLMTVVQSGFVDEGLRDFLADKAWIGAFDRINAYFAAKAG
ncbi:MAG TPA: SRPBCC domain-containing protein [Acidimicrobiia bacterium]|nr:SRPBCC domain-containing protein [Acidimicrobiia bacterium]